MVKFGDYLNDCKVNTYADYYIKYDMLKDLLDQGISKRLDGLETFYKTLESCFVGNRNVLQNVDIIY